MKIRNILAAAVLAIGTTFSANSALLIETIDDFSTAQGPIFATLGNDVDSFVTGTGIIGGERDLMLQVFVDDFNQGASVNVAMDNFFFSSGTGVEAMFTVQWDGPDSSMAINPFGLGGVDFTDGGSLATEFLSFVTFVVETDLDGWFDVTFWSGQSGDSETVMLPIPDVDAPGRTTSFSADLFTATDFSNIGAIQVRGNIESPDTGDRQRSYDLQLGSVTAIDVSTPASLGLIALGLGLIPFFRITKQYIMSNNT